MWLISRLQGLKRRIIKRISPIKYAEKTGVNFVKGVLNLYGNVEWGTEPWIITRNLFLNNL